MTKPYTCPQRFYEPLQAVATISEIAEKWHRGRSTIRYAIDAKNIAAVQSGRTWLISVPSVVAFWGPPHPAPAGDFDRFFGGQSNKTPLQINSERGKNATGERDEKRPALPAHNHLRILS